MNRRRSSRWLTAMMACIVIGLLVWGSLPRERLLLQLARPVMSTADFRPRWSTSDDLTPYFWLSDHEVGYFLNDAFDAHRTLTVRDLATGKTHKCFTASIQQIQFGEAGSLSPDGKWLLWLHNSRATVFALDGSRTVSFPAATFNFLTWMPDSRRLATSTAMAGGPALEIADLADGSVHAIPVPRTQPPGSLFFVPELLGFTAQGHAILAPGGSMTVSGQPTSAYSPQNYPIMPLVEVDLQRPAQLRHAFTIHVPADIVIGSVTLSPQGDCLLWAAHCKNAAPFQEWLHRLLPAYRPSNQAVIRWWVSRLDGTHRHEIGRATLVPNPRWMPDGKHVSFIRASVLYTVPVD